MSEENFRSRKWQVTINNPKEHKMSHEELKEILDSITGIIYWCMCDEIGKKETYHTHIFMQVQNGIRWGTMRKKFPGAHLEVANGTAQQNRDYIRKEGNLKKKDKKETNLPDTFEEYGELPVERQGQRNDLHDLYDMIKSGYSNYDIMEINPEYMLKIDKIERARQIINEEKYKDMFRKLEVTYIHGKTGTGKTRSVMERYGYINVYRITDYDHPFDGYKGQDIVLFEEFRSSLKIQDMLNYLDGYPLELPCRYNNKIACYTKVYIISNIELEEQYRNVQVSSAETYDAFIRRINNIIMLGAEFPEKENGEIPQEEKEKEKSLF